MGEAPISGDARTGILADVKYVFLALAGAADAPLSSLSGRTPLEVAKLPYLRRLARRGQVGQVFPLGEEAAQTDTFSAGAVSMALMGCDPDRYYQGPGPLEAIAAQVVLSPRDIAFCGSFLTTDGNTILDANPPISQAEMRQVTQALQERLGSRVFTFFAGAGNRAVLRWQSGERDVATTPPTRITPGPLTSVLPQGDQAERLHQLVFDSLDILDGLELNRARRDAGKPPLNTFWPWGQGEAVTLPTLLGQWAKTGAIRTQNGLVRGIAAAQGMSLAVPANATPTTDVDDFTTDAPLLLEALDTGVDVAVFHTLAPARAAQTGDVERKVHALEQIDQLVVGPMVDGLKKRGQKFRLLVTPIHQTLSDSGKHTAQSVPFLFYDSTRERDNSLPWEERVLPDTRITIDEGYRLFGRLFG